MGSRLAYVAAAVAVLAALYKLARPRDGVRTPELGYLCGSLVCLGVAAVLLAPVTLAATSTVEPSPNFTRWLGNALAMGGAFCIVEMIRHTVRRGGARPVAGRTLGNVAVLLCCVAIMLVCLDIGHTRWTVDFVNEYAHEPAIAGYEFVYCGYLGYAIVSFIGLLAPYVRAAPHRLLRIGMGTIVTGVSIAGLWVLWKISMSAVKLVSDAQLAVEGPVSLAMASVSILVIVAGVTMAAWAPLLQAPVDALRTRVASHRLRALWRELAAELPGIALPYQPMHRLTARRLTGKMALYRRVVEIRDAQLTMRAYIPADLATRVGAEADPAVLEAAGFAAAVEAHRAGHRYHDDPADGPVPRAVRRDLLAEAAALRAVARAYTSSRAVRAVRSQVRAEVGATPGPTRR